jgi:hypothetical protein
MVDPPPPLRVDDAILLMASAEGRQQRAITTILGIRKTW